MRHTNGIAGLSLATSQLANVAELCVLSLIVVKKRPF